MIKISSVSKNFHDLEVLRNINLTVDDGKIYGLVGESGTGKSTILRCINGLIPYDTGHLTVDGTEVSSLKDIELRKFRKNIGMIFQHFSLLERLNVYENIAFPLRIWGYPRKEIDQQVKRMLELVGLEEKQKGMPRELSGGQKQRVAIARSLVLNPRFLLSDESTSALDPKIAKSILHLLKDINRELGITIILVTHQMEVVRQTCDRMALLECGEIAVDGSVKDVFLKSPRAFQTLLGKDYKATGAGRSAIRIFINGDAAYQTFFSHFAMDTQIEFRLLSGGVETFKEGDAFLGVIEIANADTQKAQEYFERNRIGFEVVRFAV